MRGLLRLVTPVALAALVAGCTSDKARSGTEPSPSAPSSPSVSLSSSQSAAEKATARAKAAKVAAFIDQAEPLDRGGVPPGFSLEEVQYTSPTDAVATFGNSCKSYDVCTTVIATTHDNWAHAAGLFIPDTLADLVTYLASGRCRHLTGATLDVNGASYVR